MAFWDFPDFICRTAWIKRWFSKIKSSKLDRAFLIARDWWIISTQYLFLPTIFSSPLIWPAITRNLRIARALCLFPCSIYKYHTPGGYIVSRVDYPQEFPFNYIADILNNETEYFKSRDNKKILELFFTDTNPSLLICVSNMEIGIAEDCNICCDV